MGNLDRWDGVALLGLAIVAGGIAIIYVPAGLIAAGMALVGWAVLGAAGRRRR